MVVALHAANLVLAAHARCAREHQRKFFVSTLRDHKGPCYARGSRNQKEGVVAGNTRWIQALIPLAIVFGIVAIIAGFWMYTPIVLIAVLIVLLLRMRHGAPPE